MDKLADGLQRLGEDDLLQVVQMVHDNKAPDSYTKNDVERKFLRSQTRENKQSTNFFTRGRVPRRSLYPPRLSNQNAMGVHTGKGSSVITLLDFAPPFHHFSPIPKSSHVDVAVPCLI